MPPRKRQASNTNEAPAARRSRRGRPAAAPEAAAAERVSRPRTRIGRGGRRGAPRETQLLQQQTTPLADLQQTPPGVQREPDANAVLLTPPIARRSSVNNYEAFENGATQQLRNQGSVNSGVNNNANANASVVSSESAINLLSNTLIETMRALRQGAAHGSNVSRSGDLIDHDSKLPEFSGKPLEWSHFHEMYLETARNYSDRFNISRLKRALKGSAEMLVSTLLNTTNDPNSVINALEAYYGSPHLIARDVVYELKNLPCLKSGRCGLLEFATKLSNGVEALKSLKMSEYLNSVDLLASVAAKIPNDLKTAYYRYADIGQDMNSVAMTSLEKLARFMRRESDLARRGGIMELEPAFPPCNDNDRGGPGRGGRPPRAAAVYATAANDARDESEERDSPKDIPKDCCQNCGRSNHAIADCRDFTSMKTRRKWFIARKRRICFKCLSPGHIRPNCKSDKMCGFCKKNHHSELHFFPENDDSARSNELNEREKESTVQVAHVRCDEEKNQVYAHARVCDEQPTKAGPASRKGFLRVVPVKVHGPVHTITTCALLDGGSTTTLVHSRFARMLGISGRRLEMNMRGLYGSMQGVVCEKVSFDVEGPFGKYKIEHALIIPELELAPQTLPKDLADRIMEQEKIQLYPFRDAQVCILIGQDNWPLIMSEETRRFGNGGLAISRSVLGWTVHGYVEEAEGRDIGSPLLATCFMNNDEEDAGEQQFAELDKVVKEYIDFENCGVIPATSKGRKHERAIAILEATSRKTSEGWETGLLWKAGLMPEINSRATALKRLKMLERKLDKNPQFAALYYKEIARLIDNGYAVKVPRNLERPRIWYVPHFGVENINKPGKVRLVFDAAAKTRGVSLNDLLETGPDLLESLLGVLLRFRQYQVAVISDIKDMYLRVSLIERDRGAQRFLWRGADRDREPDEYENTSLIFGSKSSPCSAIYIKNKNAERFRDTMPEAVQSIIKNSYMDDYLASGRTILEMKQRVLEVAMINSEANFCMHGWASNEPSVIEEVRGDNQLGQTTKVSLCDNEERVLGLFWDRHEDTFSFNVGLNKIRPALLLGEEKPTKREVFSIVMSVYDPLGIIAPFVVQAKMIMQSIWRSAVKWDSRIRDEEFGPWITWLKNLPEIKKVKIPRCFLVGNFDYTNAELHIFVDASLEAYVAVAYVVTYTANERARVCLIMSKSRVAPTKRMTVPRLELQAALLGARMAATIGKEVEIGFKRRIFWTDSKVVKGWIEEDAREKNMFVGNRVAEINELTKPEEWRWVPTHLNPADDATRKSDKPMRSSDRFLVGPSFLLDGEEAWPVERSLTESEKKEIKELESRKQFLGVNFVEDPEKAAVPIKVAIFGWTSTVRLMDRIRRFFYRWYDKTTKK